MFESLPLGHNDAILDADGDQPVVVYVTHQRCPPILVDEWDVYRHSRDVSPLIELIDWGTFTQVNHDVPPVADEDKCECQGCVIVVDLPAE